MKYLLTIFLLSQSFFVHAQVYDSAKVLTAASGDWVVIGTLHGDMIYLFAEIKGTDKGTYVRVKFESKAVTYKNKLYKNATREESWFVDCSQKKYTVSKSTLFGEKNKIIYTVENHDTEWKDFPTENTMQRLREWICD